MKINFFLCAKFSLFIYAKKCIMHIRCQSKIRISTYPEMLNNLFMLCFVRNITLFRYIG